MGIQARVVPRRDAGAADVEKAPLMEDEDSGLKDHPRAPSTRRLLALLPLLALGLYLASLSPALKSLGIGFPFPTPSPGPLPPFVIDGMRSCEIISRPPPHHADYTSARTHSDRFVRGTRPVYLKNATIWTGEDGGKEVLYGKGVWLEGGVVRRVGDEDDMQELLAGDKDVDKVDLHGAWVTPGIVDVHAHLGVDPLPSLVGSDSTNSIKNPVLPYLRSLDGFNTHDAAFNLSIAGGITTMLVLPGSAGNIGGQAFTFKPRATEENTPRSMQVEPPFIISENEHGKGHWERTRSWRHIKHACGENPLRVYQNTRMDSAYDFRRAYTEGKLLMEKQDRWCASPKTQTEPFPDSLEWEAMADIIRGNVKVNIHCYETVDIADMIQISNEFQFPIAAFHHAHEAYMVTHTLKKAWGGTPAVAIFANNARYKREAYRGTPYAGKILVDHNITLIHKSDAPVLSERELMYEAAQSHAMGVPFAESLASVTSAAARTAGLGHRMGYVRPGYDADIVVWDSFPLTLGATPKQTYIDGIPQIIKPHVISKPRAAQKITKPGDYEKEAAEALATRGDPDLRPKRIAHNIVLENVSALYMPEVVEQFAVTAEPRRVIVDGGEIVCVGHDCAVPFKPEEYETIDLQGGSLSRGLITTGSKLGLMEIAQEELTHDGVAYDPTNARSRLLSGLLVHAVDGARFEGKDELMAYHAGVTTGVTSPISSNLFSGISYSFSTSAPHALAKGAIGNPAAALHLDLDNWGTSVSTKIALIRRLLSGKDDKEDELHKAFDRAAAGKLRLVVATHNADVISALVRLKRDVAPKLKLTILGGHESWLVASDLAKEDIGVIISPARTMPAGWDQRRNLPGPPLSNMTLPAFLASEGVKVGLGIQEECDARLTRYNMAWAYASSPHIFSRQKALDLVSTNLEDLLGLNDNSKGLQDKQDLGWVAYEGDMFELHSRVRAVRAPGQNSVDLL